MYILKQRRGEFSLNSSFMLLLVAMLLLLSISVLGVANTSVQLRSMADELLRYTELRGKVDGAVWTELDRLETVMGMEVECRIEADFMPGSSQKVQYGGVIDIQLTCDRSFGLGGVVSIPIPVNAAVSGRSEVYWK